MSTDEARINVSRLTYYPDRLRTYTVLVDEIEMGRVAAGGAVSFTIAPGDHQIHLKIDWCISNIVNFSARPGNDINFECGSSLSGGKLFLVLLYITIWWDKYLWLRMLD